MATVEMVMPKMGESIMEGTILGWMKKPGDKIEQDESVLEVATDKVDTEVPATHGGILKEILAQEGDVVEVGKPIAIIETEGGESVSAPAPTTPAPAIQAQPVAAQVAQPTTTVAAPSSNGSSSNRFYSPLVLNIAREENIPMQELESVAGTGKEGRVTKKDILSYVQHRGTGSAPVATPATTTAPVAASTSTPVSAPATKPSTPAISVNSGDEIIEMDRMRKMIAQRMVESKHTSPHVTSFVEADVSNLVAWRNKAKKVFIDRENEKLTFTPMMIECIVKAIKDYPMINISVDGDRIIKRKDINIGLAVALPSGNLIVPVIRNADQYNLVGLTKKVNDLAKKARENKLTPDELSGGTFTVSNVGSFGNMMGTPIIMQPQVGIMALGAIKKKPAVIETEMGDTIGIRHLMFLSHSYDHRVVDGSLGGMVVRRAADYMEQWNIHREI